MNTNDNQEKLPYYIILTKRLFSVIVGLLFVMFIVGQIVYPDERDSINRECEEFVSDWYQVCENGERVPVEVPGKIPAEYGETVTIVTTLPDEIYNRQNICFKVVWQDVELYIDGELRESYSTKDSRPFGKNSAMKYIFLELYEEDEGKELTFSFTSDSKYAGDVRTMYTGDRASIWLYFVSEYASKTLIAVLLLCVSFFCVVACIILKYVYKKDLSLKYLAWTLFFCAVWMISETEFRQLLFKNVSVLSNYTYIALMLIPFHLTIYIDDIQEGRYRKLYAVPIVYSTIIVVCATFLQVFDIVQFVEMLPYIHGGIAITMVCMIGTITVDVFRKKISEYLFVGIGIYGMLLSAIIEIVLYYTSSKYTLGAILASGLLFLLVMAIVKTGRDWFKSEQKRQQAVLSSKAQAQFLANMSHEIRTPINAVIGMNEMILRENENETIQEYAYNIKSSSTMLLGLVNDVLDFSKIESGQLELVEESYNLADLIQAELVLSNARAVGKPIDIHVEVDQDLPTRLFGDELRIKQIVTNLLSNAVKYTKEGSVTLKVNFEWNDDEIMLYFIVSDTGIGIKQEDLEKLFSGFKRLELNKNRNIEGTGLGLNIAKSLVELMNGTINVESEYGKGSTFTVSIPQSVVDRTPIGDMKENTKKNRKEQNAKKGTFLAPEASVLVVDDNMMNLAVTKALLKRTKMHLEMVESGRDCLKVTKDRYFDIILLDHMMPELDGIETLQMLRADENNPNRNTVVIALTANAIAGCREMYLEHGFDDYCSKPIKGEVLDALMIQHLPKEKVQLLEEKSE